jgi:hypothetical protein
MDLYDVEVGRIRVRPFGNTYDVVKSAEGLYSDQLRPFIEKATGMYLSLRKGGQIEKAIKQKLSKSFELPLQMAIYVPSTKDKNVVITKKEMDERVLDVKSYLAELFGGFNSVKVEGGFESSDKGLIEEDAVRVVAFATQDGFENKFQKLVFKIKFWCKEWAQESIGLEFENDLFYIEAGSEYSNGGMIEHKTEDGETLKYKIDKDEMSVEVDFPTMEYLSENGIVMKREARKLRETYIFWYDQINDSSREELEEVLKIELPISDYKDDDDYEDYAKGGSISDAAYKSRMKKFGFQPYGKTKGKFKVTYNAEGKPQSETWDSMEMALDTANRYSKIDEFSDVRIFDESGKDISNKWMTYMERGGEVYKLGDKYSDDFDYKGMLKMGLKAQTSWGSKKLRKLFDSYEDVNYHEASTNLWNAIQSIQKSEDVQTEEAKAAYILAADNYIERFHDDVIEEMLVLTEDVKEKPEDDWKKIQDSYKVNVYGKMSAKDYYGVDSKSSALKWFKLNGTPMSKARGEKFAEPYIERLGRSNVHIGGMEYGGMGKGSRRFTINLGYKDGGQVDLFEQIESLPEEVQNVLGRYSLEDESYDNMENLLSELKPLGYTFEYGLDAVPYGLTKMADGGMMAKGGILNVEDNIIFLKDLFVTQETDEYDSERGVGGKTLKIVKVDESNRVYYLKEAGDYYKYIISFKQLQGWIEEKYVEISKSMASGGMMAKGGKIGFNVGDIVELKEIPENFPIEIRKGLVENKWKVTRVSMSGRSLFSDVMEDIFGYDIELADKSIDFKAFVYPNEIKAYKMADGGMMAKSGKVKKRVRFVDKVESIADRLEGTKVPKTLKKDYGGKYNREESEEAARRIAGAQLRDRKM